MSSVVKDGVRLAALLAGIVASASAAPGQSTQPEGQSKSVVYLTIHHYTNVDTDLRLLPRELYRQALLIAARDEMGLSTRDQALREWKNDPPAGVTLDMPYVANELRIESPAAPGAVLWGYTPPSRKLNEEMNLPAITKAAEKLSREDFVTVLQANGWQAAARPAHNDLPAPQDAEKLLGHLEELSQFAALREAHEAIRQSGESPARLGVLVRAYANLGSLTQFHWSVEDKVYSARALLYSQRMVSEYPKSADALWHRAYARALAGLLGPAQHDCDAAAAFHQGDTPPWALPLSAFCNYKVGDLTQLAVSNPDSASLTMYLAFLSVERSGAQGAYMGLAQAALSVNPDCLRLIDAMCADTGPGMLNELSVRGPTIFSRILAWELEKMPGLPRDIAKSMGELRRAEGNLQRRESICQDLIASGSLDRDQMEPSLAALGRLIQETTFAHIRRRADTLAIWLGINATDYVTEVRPFIADHPFRYLIEAYSHTRELAPHAVRDELAKQPWEDVKLDEYRLYGMENETGVKGPGTSRKFWFTLEYDPVARDLEEMARRFFNSGNDMKWPWILETLEDAAPESPRLLALKIQFQWSDDKAVEWERAHGDHPTVAMALGRKYIRLKRWADAERCIRQYIAVSPDRFGYQELADVYLSQHDDDRWLSTLKEYLEKPDYGLQHAQIQNEIAIHFMLRREYDRAVPYADAAAQTGWEIGLPLAGK